MVRLLTRGPSDAAVNPPGISPFRAGPLGFRGAVDAVGLGDHGDAAFGDGEAALPVELVVVADLDASGDVDALVDDRPADLGVPADVDAVEEDRVLAPGRSC